MDRREFLQLMGAASAGAVLAKSGALRSMGLSRSGDSTSTSLPNPNTSTQPIVVGKGSTPITMWVQLFGPAVIWFHTAASNYASKNPDVTITVLPVPYTSLQSKILPSIAAGTEADIMFAYNDWFFSNDVTELFLNLSKYMGGAKTLDAIAYPSALSAVALPAGQAYYVPDLAGIRGASLTVNATQFEKKGINYLNLATWDDVISAAKELTEFKGSTMTRSGLSPITGLANLAMLQSWVWQLGGEFYNTETGKWNFSTAEGKAAAQALYDLYWTDKVASFDLANYQQRDHPVPARPGVVQPQRDVADQLHRRDRPGLFGRRDRDALSDRAHRFGLGPRRDLGYHAVKGAGVGPDPNCSTAWACWRS